MIRIGRKVIIAGSTVLVLAASAGVAAASGIPGHSSRHHEHLVASDEHRVASDEHRVRPGSTPSPTVIPNQPPPATVRHVRHQHSDHYHVHVTPASPWRTSPVSGISTTPCPCGTTTAPPHGPPTPSTPPPTPDNTSADPVDLGTVTLTYDDADGDACATTGEGFPVSPEGLNASGTESWYEFTVGALDPSCPQPQIGVEAVGNSATTGYFGVAATPSGVDADTPIGTVYHVPWPETGGTFYVEVIGTGYFDVDVVL